MKQGTIVWVIVCILLCACKPAATPTPSPTDQPTPTWTPRPIVPSTSTPTPVPTDALKKTYTPPAPDELSVNSYPAGAEVYLVPATTGIYNLNLDAVMEAGNRLGTAPLIHELAPGTYYVATSFSSNLFTSAGCELPELSHPTFDDAFPPDGNAIQSMSFLKGQAIERLSKVYRVTMRAGESAALISIALPLPEEEREPDPMLYPTFATVEALPISYACPKVMQDSIVESLSQNNLTGMISMVDEIVAVLLRVGKVELVTSTVDLTVQIDTEGTRLTISTRQ